MCFDHTYVYFFVIMCISLYTVCISPLQGQDTVYDVDHVAGRTVPQWTRSATWSG